MNVLAIGNSFSQDATRYLHSIARADGVDLNVVNLYIGGCSLEKHYRNMLSKREVYELQFNGECTGFLVSLEQALLNRKWDVVTVQQVSTQSFIEESYFPYIQELVNYVKKYQPKAKIYLHQTWAYEDGSERLLNVAKFDTAKQMLNDIISANQKVANELKVDKIIKSGELLGKILDSGIEKIHRDTFHATLGLGRYALGLLWYKTLTGNSVLNNSFNDFDEPVDNESVELVKNIVENM